MWALFLLCVLFCIFPGFFRGLVALLVYAFSVVVALLPLAFILGTVWFLGLM